MVDDHVVKGFVVVLCFWVAYLLYLFDDVSVDKYDLIHLDQFDLQIRQSFLNGC